MKSISTLADRIVSIEYPEDGEVRARKVVSRSKARSTTKYPSWKMARMTQCESSYELFAHRLLDANPAVRSFAEQPLTIRYILDGVERRHYPDILVQLVDGSQELWEVKSKKNAAEPETQARTRFLQAALPDHGFAYRIVLGEDLGREPRMSNVRQMLTWGRPSISLHEYELMRAALALKPSITWEEAQSGLGPRGRHIVARHVLEGRLAFDLDAKLTPETVFRATNAGQEL